MKGLDASFTYLSPDKAIELRNAGYEVWAQCLWTGIVQPPNRVINLRNAINAGIIPVGYISLNGDSPGLYHVSMGRSGVPDDIWSMLVLVSIDVELPGIQNSEIRHAVDETVRLNKRRSIYCSWYSWYGYHSDSHDFTDCLLWNANWRGVPPTKQGEYFSQLSFGGWQPDQVIGEQWSGGTNIHGVYVDQDMFVKEMLMPKTLTFDESLGINKAIASVLAVDRDADKLVQILKYVYAVKGWQWSS